MTMFEQWASGWDRVDPEDAWNAAIEAALKILYSDLNTKDSILRQIKQIKSNPEN